MLLLAAAARCCVCPRPCLAGHMGACGDRRENRRFDHLPKRVSRRHALGACPRRTGGQLRREHAPGRSPKSGFDRSEYIGWGRSPRPYERRYITRPPIATKSTPPPSAARGYVVFCRADPRYDELYDYPSHFVRRHSDHITGPGARVGERLSFARGSTLLFQSFNHRSFIG